jgi:uncharacterized phage protein (TIGR01671 family)
MREIKFRAWDISHNNLGMSRPFGIGARTAVFSPNDLEFDVDIDFVNQDFMQYTGLKDKHGRPIFESDILKKDYGSSTPIGVVEYHEDRAAFIFQDGYNGLLFEVIPHVEIIGNIHESPELLGEEQ